MLAVEPILLLVTLYLSLVYGVLYACKFFYRPLFLAHYDQALTITPAVFEALPFIFVETRGFNIGESGLIFIGVGIGTTAGAAAFVPLSRHYPKLMKEWRGFPPAEQRLFGAMLGGPSLVIGCFWLGWTGNYPNVPWIVPALATIPIGASVSMVFISFFVSTVHEDFPHCDCSPPYVQTYLVDVYLMYTASALAASTMIRSAVGAAFPLFTTQMFQNVSKAFGSFVRDNDN